MSSNPPPPPSKYERTCVETKRQQLENKEQAKRKAARIEEQRKGELEVDQLPEGLRCTFLYDFGPVKTQCPEEGTQDCANCGNIMCVAHVKSSVTTHVAKPVVKKGGKELAVAHKSQYCVECATDADGNIIGTLNESFNCPGEYV